MAGRGTGPDFVEALARGLDVLAALGDGPMTLAEVAAARRRRGARWYESASDEARKVG